MYKIVKNINPNIFRGYDIRGVIDEDLNEDVYYTLGRAYATFLTQRRIKEAAVGRDNRRNGEPYAKAIIQALNDGGIDTVDIGLSMSQIVYYSSYEYKTKGGVMISASHNPGNYNGLKLGVGYSDTMVTEEILEMRDIAAKGIFSEGHGTNRKDDVFPSYLQTLLKLFEIKNNWKIVVDTCNATGGMFYPRIFREAGCTIIEQNTSLDSNYPLGDPDPTESKVLERLAIGVKEHGADLGFAFDADGDRMSVVDDKGQILWMDTIVALFSKDVLETMPGAPIVYNTLCSRQVTESIVAAGGKPVMWLTGHSFIKAKVKEARSPFGGELSGHIFFMDNFFGHDDGAYACLRLLSYLERKGKKLSELVAELPKYISSPEIKFGLADDIKFKFIAEVITAEFKKNWPTAEYIDIDGIRMDLPDQMAIIRASQNGPYATVKFEAKTKEDYETLKQTIKGILSKYKEVDLKKGTNTHALE
jgi:phosphomannomutase/phosphoglucomutase